MGDFILPILFIGGYLLPFWIALYRNHMYKWVILALTIGGGWTGLLWVGSLVWAVWPDNKSLVDPLMGNVTGRGERNTGDIPSTVNQTKEKSNQEKIED